MLRIKYMHVPLEIFSQHVIEQYDLGLLQSGNLANEYLEAKLAPTWYYKGPHTLGIWKHISHPVEFTSVVDDFGVKYVGEEHIQHLIDMGFICNIIEL